MFTDVHNSVIVIFIHIYFLFLLNNHYSTCIRYCHQGLLHSRGYRGPPPRHILYNSLFVVCNISNGGPIDSAGPGSQQPVDSVIGLFFFFCYLHQYTLYNIVIHTMYIEYYDSFGINFYYFFLILYTRIV